jgi:hypothetical protein
MGNARGLKVTYDPIDELRREISEVAHEASKIVGPRLPRRYRICIAVRDTSGGCAIRKGLITASAALALVSRDEVRAIVWRELAVAYLNAEYDGACALMGPGWPGEGVSKASLTLNLRAIAFRHREKRANCGMPWDQYPLARQ